MTMLATLWTATLLLSGSDSVQQPPEYRVKAFYLFNLGSQDTIQWPASAFPKKDSPFRIGILGKDPMGNELEAAIRNGRRQGRKVEVVRTGDLKDLKTCHIVFVPKTERRRMKDVLSMVQGRPTLVVGESAGFAKAGGGVNFYLTRDDRVSLELNPAAVTRAGLSLRARFLQIVKARGRIVEEE